MNEVNKIIKRQDSVDVVDADIALDRGSAAEIVRKSLLKEAKQGKSSIKGGAALAATELEELLSYVAIEVIVKIGRVAEPIIMQVKSSLESLKAFLASLGRGAAIETDFAEDVEDSFPDSKLDEIDEIDDEAIISSMEQVKRQKKINAANKFYENFDTEELNSNLVKIDGLKSSYNRELKLYQKRKEAIKNYKELCKNLGKAKEEYTPFENLSAIAKFLLSNKEKTEMQRALEARKKSQLLVEVTAKEVCELFGAETLKNVQVTETFRKEKNKLQSLLKDHQKIEEYLKNNLNAINEHIENLTGLEKERDLLANLKGLQDKIKKGVESAMVNKEEKR